MEPNLIISLDSGTGQAPEWIYLLPLGQVALGDGREPFNVDQAALEAIVQHFQGRGLDLVIDYEHQTLSGQKAPAAGWIKELTGREDGLWARVEWTEAARGHLEAKEYRYFSPVLRLDQESRRPVALLHLALTNTPAINHLTPLVAKCRGQGSEFGGQALGNLSVTGEVEAQNIQAIPGWDKNKGMEMTEAKEEGMNESIERLKTKLGLKEEATAGEVLALAEQRLTAMPALSEVASLLDLPENASTSQIKGAVMALKGSTEQFSTLSQELTTIKASLKERQVQEAVQEALEAGKIQPSQKDSALKYARSDMEGFKTFVEKSLRMVPLDQIVELQEDTGRAEGQATPQEMAVCEAMGIAPEAFKAQEKIMRSQSLI